ncbi:GCN5-related N-acetyltransferase [Coriobacterium glomerans PW2]|uniref:GCN5-related N-acetyltransferase n=1 Tax=Coriobacterium glomerans (strain ATCC 49209 / DSM 20642 / JCM 10262 / PW2) TaxID=700015 RepID=F2N946_CORGP|nr:GNAT family N-acetyltransferase [Coriobacterium glomerans]AEB07722.1 GCN5-related N-acetyltransferase [Coriobacterium glomerans PW2]
MNNATLSVIEWNSSHYLRCLTLRNEQLRRDEGLEDLLIAPEEEARCIHLAAIIDKEIVATMHLEPIDESEIRICQMVVARFARGRGIGADLIAFGEQIAAEMGFRVITLNGKIEAWGFYERLGFTACGDQRAWMSTTVKPYRKRIGCSCRSAHRGTRVLESRLERDDLRRDNLCVAHKHARHRRAARPAGVCG